MNRRVLTWIATLVLMIPAPARAHFHQMPPGPPNPKMVAFFEIVRAAGIGLTVILVALAAGAVFRIFRGLYRALPEDPQV
jgi:hypothetical protein